MFFTHAFNSSFGRHPRMVQVRPSIELVGRIGLLLAVYWVFERVLRQAGHLSAQSYAQPVIALELLKHIFASPITLIGCATVCSVLIIRHRRLMDHWFMFEQGKQVRWFVSIVALVSAWTFTTYDINLYFNQPHVLDRVLLAGLAVLVVWRPVLIIPYTFMLFAMIWQLDYPLVTQYPWTEMNMLVRILTLWSAAYLTQLLTRGNRTSEFLFATLCLIASFYWGSGIGKFELNWIAHPHLNLLWAGAFANGWLSFLQPEQIASIVKATQPLALPLMAFTLLVEWAVLTILAHRNVTRFFLFGFIVFHTGIFVVTGMLFWKWIVIEIALIILFFARKATAPNIYSATRRVLSVLVIACGGLLFKPSNLSWYDTRLAYIYQLRGVDRSGKEYEIPIRSLTPYADTFTLGNFGYLSHHPQLTHIWGVTSDRHLASLLASPKQRAEIFALENTQGTVLYDETKSRRFDDFVQQYFAHLNARGTKPAFFTPLQAPPHLWTIPRDPVFTGQEPLVRVIVYQRTWLLEDDTTTVIRTRHIRTIDIPSKEAGVS